MYVFLKSFSTKKSDMILSRGKRRTMNEVWVVIEEFPMYKVSDKGRVINIETGKLLKESTTKTGLVKIGLWDGGKQYTRGLSLIVAQAFVDGRTDTFDTLIHLDGEPDHNHADNLMWRPRWFAWKYRRQFQIDSHNHSRGPIVDLDKGVKYVNMFDAAMCNGLLVHDVGRSVMYQKATYPTEQQFGLVD